jgi:hypothetical protein
VQPAVGQARGAAGAVGPEYALVHVIDIAAIEADVDPEGRAAVLSQRLAGPMNDAIGDIQR